MRIFTGPAGGSLGQRLTEQDVGILFTPEEWRTPRAGRAFAIDNGAWAAHTRGERWTHHRDFRGLWDLATFSERESLDGCGKYERTSHATRRADFWVAPDIVGGGRESLELSLSFLEIAPAEHRWLIAVQEGMTPGMVEEALAWLEEEGSARARPLRGRRGQEVEVDEHRALVVALLSRAGALPARWPRQRTASPRLGTPSRRRQC